MNTTRSRIAIITACALSLGGAFTLLANHHAPKFQGTWHVTGELPDGGTSESTLTIEKKGADLHAVSVNAEGTPTEIDRIQVDGHKLELEIDVEQDGQTGVIGATAELNDKGALKGIWFMRGSDGTEYASEAWMAVRSLAPALPGAWEVVAVTDDGDNKHELVFTKSGSRFAGVAKTTEGSIDLANVRVQKNELRLELPYGEGTVKVKAHQTGPESLIGQWTYLDDIGQEAAYGDWKASKAKAMSPIVGSWNLKLAFQDYNRESTIEIAQSGNGYKATYITSEGDRIQPDTVTFEDGQLTTITTREMQGREVQWVLKAKLNDSGNLSGTLSPRGLDNEFSVIVTGTKD